MRSTLTLDPDVAARLRSVVRRTGRSFKAVVNSLLRAGLEAETRPAPGKRYVVRPQPMGLRPGMDLDNVGDLLEQLEGPRHR